MSFDQFMKQALSAWMSQQGPDGDIVLSSRVRLARNLATVPFPAMASVDELHKVIQTVKQQFADETLAHLGTLQLVTMEQLKAIEKRVLVEKHLISPQLAATAEVGACLLSENEEISIMINEEDHVRIQCLFPGLQLKEALDVAQRMDDWFEQSLDYAYSDKLGYLTSCPTNVGTGLRASVMMHLPALTMTGQMNQLVQAITQFGLVVRGTFGEGSEVIGNIYQISNQITLGKSEDDIVDDLLSIVEQLIAQERQARQLLLQNSPLQIEDKIFRSYGLLAHSRIIETKEAARYLSDVRLGIDLGFITHISSNILNELMVLMQPGFLQLYAQNALRPQERDVRRASLIRERLQMEMTS